MLAPIYTATEIRELERAVQSAVPGVSLMALAGRAAAEHARHMAGDHGRTILMLAGPGNNGGDAFAAAVHLKSWFYRVTVAFAGNVNHLPTDARSAFESWRESGGTTVDSIPAHRVDLIVDGLYGIGLGRPITGRDALWIDWANGRRAQGTPILALDIPSGIAGDSGEVLGTAIRASETLTFIGLKPGLLTLDGPDHCGLLHTALLLDQCQLDAATLLPSHGHYVQTPEHTDWPAPRPRNFHKGRAGSVAVIGGQAGMVGAAILAARAALHMGAGKVFLGLPEPSALAVDPLTPELIIRAADALLTGERLSVLAIGPGLGTDGVAQRLTAQGLRTDVAAILDADALNLLSTSQLLQSALATRHAATVLTPHPAEAGRLLGVSTAAVQSDRVRAAREIAKRYRAIVVLKGNGSIIATADGRYWINGSGNPGMAAAGMGDVLTGMVAGLLAQQADAHGATRLGVWLHGAAGDALLASGQGPRGLTASELSLAARRHLNSGPSAHPTTDPSE